VKTGVFTVRLGDDTHTVAITAAGQARIGDGEPLSLAAEGNQVYAVTDGARTWRVFVVAAGERRQAFVEGEVYEFTVGTEAAGPRRPPRSGSDQLCAPMPAKVTAILVETGQQVRKGDILLKLEAMKMELAVRAPRDATVKSIGCRPGELVQPGVGLLELT
jgi:biotin carboxyl carrier protein